MTAMIVITCIENTILEKTVPLVKVFFERKNPLLKGKPTFLSLLQHIKKNHDFNE